MKCLTITQKKKSPASLVLSNSPNLTELPAEALPIGNDYIEEVAALSNATVTGKQ
jgi:hypothetical protein